MRIVIPILLFVFLPFLKVNATYHKQYTTSDGLLSNDVYHVVKDRKGYLWFCTPKGVVRYNGLSFEKFNIFNGLTDNDVFNCYEDMQERMWFYTANGKYCYYKNGTIYNSANDTLLQRLSSGWYSYINEIYEDPEDSTLYIGHVDGIILKIRNNKISTIDCMLDGQGKLRQIYQLNKTLRVISTTQWIIIQNDSIVYRQQKKLHDSYMYGDKLVIVDADGLKLYVKEKIVWQANDKNVCDNNVYDPYYDGKGNIFCGTINGLVVYNINNNSKRVFFNGSRITSITEDIHGNFWCSTFGNGVFRLNRSVLENMNVVNTENCDITRTKNGQFFLTCGHDIYLLSFSGDTVLRKKIPVRKNDFEPVYLSEDAFYYYRMGKEGFFCVHDLKTGRSKNKNFTGFSRAYWIDSNRYIFYNHLEIATVRAIRSSFFLLNRHMLKYPIRSEYFDKKTGYFFFFSKNQLYRYNTKTLQLQVLDTVDEIGGNNTILYEEGRIILILNNKQVIIYSREEKPARETEFDLPFPVYDLMKTEPGKYIVHSENGYEILRLKRFPFSITMQKIVYPFAGDDILALFLDGKNVVCKAKNELYSFPVTSLNKVLCAPKLYTSKIVLNGTPHFTGKHDIVTNNKTNVNVFLSPVYFINDKLTYRYRIIEGGSMVGPWNKTDASELNFLFNNTGDYAIQMQALSGATISNTETIQLTIKPTFFSSVPFYTLSMSLGLLVLGAGFRVYHLRKRRMLTNEMNYLQMEHRSINSLLNPHFIFNTISNIQSLINEGSKEQANEYLATLSIMIRQNIENLQFSFIPLEKELNLVEHYIELQNLRFDNNICYSLNNDVPCDIYIPPLLIHTFIENAIVHGYDKENVLNIQLDITRTPDEYLTITISDDGKGLNNTLQNTSVQKDKISLGIAFTKKRLERLSKFYNVRYSLELQDVGETTGGRGTRINVVFYSRFAELVAQLT